MKWKRKLDDFPHALAHRTSHIAHFESWSRSNFSAISIHWYEEHMSHHHVTNVFYVEMECAYYCHKISVCSVFVLRACIICSIKIMWLFCVHAYFLVCVWLCVCVFIHCMLEFHSVSSVCISNGVLRKILWLFDPLLFRYIPYEPMRMHSRHI